MRIDVYHHFPAQPGGQYPWSELLHAIHSTQELIVASKEEAMAAAAKAQASLDAAEARAEAIISQLNELVAQLQARPEVPDDVVAALQAISADADAFEAPAVEPPAEG